MSTTNTRPATAGRPRIRATRPAAAALIAVLLVALPGALARAQSAVGAPADLQFSVRDATTGQPAVPERVVIEYIAGRLSTVFDSRPAGADFTAAAVPVKDIGQYVITLWHQGVPYWWQKRGTDLLAGPVKLDVFSVTEARDAVTVTGLNLVVRQRGAAAELELLAEVTNDARPQATVLRAGGTLELPLPAGATAVEATYQRGPEPTPVPVTVTGSRASLAVPLTPGANRIRLVARAPWDDVLELAVGSDLPLAAWSLLVAPASVGIEGAGLEAPDETSAPGLVRRAGPALGAGESLAVRLLAGAQAGEPEQLFAQEQPAGGDGGPTGEGAPGRAEGKGGFPAPLAALAALIIIGALVIARRGRH